eukprot:gene33306-44586_t
MTEEVFMGIDLGGSHITVIIVDEEGNVIDKMFSVIIDRSIQSVLSLLAEVCKKMLLKHTKIVAAGIAIPGNVDPTLGCTRYLPNFGWLDPVPVKSILQEQANTSISFSLRNDGRCAALAEYNFGVGKGSKVFSMLTLGTGIGGALIKDGILFDGVSFDAGDFGHHVICSGSDAFSCVCGKSGCFECHASASGLVRHYQRIVQASGCNDNGVSESDGKGNAVVNAEQVVALVRQQDMDAVTAFARFKDDLSTGLANLVTFYNPDVIALGGGLSQAPEVFNGLEAAVDAKTLPATRGKVRVLPAMLSVEAPCLLPGGRSGCFLR